MKKNAVVGQSGGPTAVINASLYGTVYEALNREDEIGTVYGMINGIEGFLNDQVMDMAPLEESKELELIRTTPGSYLGSCRYKLPEDLNDPVYPQLFARFEAYNIGYLEVPQNTSLLLCGRLLSTHPFMTTKNPLPLLRLWDAMPDGSLLPAHWPESSNTTTRF